jgi:hypothetical protein
MLSPEFWYASKVFFFLFSPSFSLEIITRKRREKKQKNRKKTPHGYTKTPMITPPVL